MGLEGDIARAWTGWRLQKSRVLLGKGEARAMFWRMAPKPPGEQTQGSPKAIP